MANIAANNTTTFSWWRPVTWDGEKITQGLRAFNNWRDDFLIELTTLLLMVGFVVGTIDVLTSGGLSQISFINYAWAIVQAVAIDGLFFAVWGKIRRLEWTWRLAFSNIMLIGVGVLLAIVAALVNNILGYEELNHVATLAQVMQSLGVDATIFSYVRSTLVVLVSILVALFARNHGPTLRELMATIAQQVEEITGLRAMRDSLATERDGLSQRAMDLEKERDGLRATMSHLEKEWAMQATEFEKERATWSIALENERADWTALRGELDSEIEDLRKKLAHARARRGYSENSTALTLQSRSHGLRATGYTSQDNPQNGATVHEEDRATGYVENGLRAMPAHEDTGYVARDDGETMAVANSHGDTIIATGSHRDRIKEVMARAMQSGDSLSYQAIAAAAGAGYSTVKKYAKVLEEEIKRELTGEITTMDGSQEATS